MSDYSPRTLLIDVSYAEPRQPHICRVGVLSMTACPPLLLRSFQIITLAVESFGRLERNGDELLEYRVIT